MKTARIPLFVLAAAMAATGGQPVGAQDAKDGKPTVEDLAAPQSTVSGGGAYLPGEDPRRAGKYSGLRESDQPYGLLDVDVNRRDDETGTWLRLKANDLGLDSRDARIEHERQGNWKYFLEYNQTPLFNPLEIRTPLTGVGDNIQRNTGGHRQLDLDTQRYDVKGGFAKVIGDSTKVNVAIRREAKTGARQWGAQGFSFITEPIDFETTELDAKASYGSGGLQVTGGYLGSLFRNRNEVLYNSSDMPTISLPLDNQAHQGYLSGAYSFTPTTQANAKVSYTRGIQNEPFFMNSTGPTLRTSLDGMVDTALAQVGVSSRPLTDLSLRAKLRYEDRDDKTAVYQYLTRDDERSGYNPRFDRSSIVGDAEATYRLPYRVSLTGGFGWEHWEREMPSVRQASWRKETDEQIYKVGLSQPVTETVTWSLGYAYSERDGSAYAPNALGLIDPIHWADRDRHKVRANVDWSPIETLSMQFRYEGSNDAYNGRQFGPRDGTSHLAAIDTSYTVTPNWSVNGWVSASEITRDQVQNGDGTINGTALTDHFWAAELSHRSTAFGAGVRGKPTRQLQVGADAQFSVDRDAHDLSGLSGFDIPDLPNIWYRQIMLSLFADYAIQKNYGVRLGYRFLRTTTNDWTWKNFYYSDNGDSTVVQIDDAENAHFIGLSLYARW